MRGAQQSAGVRPTAAILVCALRHRKSAVLATGQWPGKNTCTRFRSKNAGVRACPRKYGNFTFTKILHVRLFQNFSFGEGL
jgi:hypothetical protein